MIYANSLTRHDVVENLHILVSKTTCDWEFTYNFERLVFGCIDAVCCKYLLVGRRILFEKEIGKKGTRFIVSHFGFQLLHHQDLKMYTQIRRFVTLIFEFVFQKVHLLSAVLVTLFVILI